MLKRFASIDIGTNTILMLIAEKIDINNFLVLTDEHSIARLGEGIGINNSKKIILPQAKTRAVRILKKYKSICENYDVKTIKIVATSALRDAENKKEIIADLEEAIGNRIDIISGKDEAEYSFIGAVDTEHRTCVIDIGGGSTEIIFGENYKILQRNSLQIGAIRIKEKFLGENPLTKENIKNTKREINAKLKTVINNLKTDLLFAVAGTPTNLAAIDLSLKKFDENKIQGYVLTLEKIKTIFDELKKMTANQISKIYGINPMRADVISAGTLILIEFMNYFNFDRCIVSTKGLRYGVMKYLIKDDK